MAHPVGIALLTASLLLAVDAESQAPAVQPGRIDSFQGDYRFLSNFWPAEVIFENLTFPSVEHAYQAAKTLSLDQRQDIARLATPAEAKKAGHKLPQRPDWERVKFDVMEECVRYKFTNHEDLKAKLVATGETELVEGNDWGDVVWGVYQGKGENRLGKILMKIRSELREASVGR